VGPRCREAAVQGMFMPRSWSAGDRSEVASVGGLRSTWSRGRPDWWRESWPHGGVSVVRTRAQPWRRTWSNATVSAQLSGWCSRGQRHRVLPLNGQPTQADLTVEPNPCSAM
jgi:hypothetical protein